MIFAGIIGAAPLAADMVPPPAPWPAAGFAGAVPGACDEAPGAGEEDPYAAPGDGDSTVVQPASGSIPRAVAPSAQRIVRIA